MASLDVERIIREISALGEAEKQELAEKVLPFLLTTRTGIEQIDKSLASLSDEDLDAIIERARARQKKASEEEVGAVIYEAIKAARASRRH